MFFPAERNKCSSGKPEPVYCCDILSQNKENTAAASDLTLR